MSSLKVNLKTQAIAAMQFSHSPYSQKKIGACVLLSNGKSYSGCNIENASYGGTVCAERVAIWKAFSENKGEHVTEIYVASDEATPWPPCGFCRQVLAEFSKPETLVHLVNLTGIEKTFQFQELLPEAFKPEHLK
jgi:cytidine deaminase